MCLESKPSVHDFGVDAKYVFEFGGNSHQVAPLFDYAGLPSKPRLLR